MLRIDFVISTAVLDDWFDADSGLENIGHLFSHIDAFAATCKAMYKNAQSYVDVYVRELHYNSSVPEALRNSIPEMVVEEFQEDIRQLPSNWMSYRAALSGLGDECSFYGMDLDIEGCGHFDSERFDALIDEALEKSIEDSNDAFSDIVLPEDLGPLLTSFPGLEEEATDEEDVPSEVR